MQNDSLIRPIEKMFFWGKKERIDPLGKSTQRNTPTTKTRLLDALSENPRFSG